MPLQPACGLPCLRGRRALPYDAGRHGGSKALADFDAEIEQRVLSKPSEGRTVLAPCRNMAGKTMIECGLSIA